MGIFYLIRIFIGSFSSGIFPTPWLIIMTFLLSLVITIAKRRGELVSQLQNNSSRKVLSHYNKTLLDAYLTMISGITIVSYILYSLSPEVMLTIGSKYLFSTAFWVIIGFFRFLQSIFVNNSLEDPIRFFYKDNFIKITIFLWILNFIFLRSIN